MKRFRIILETDCRDKTEAEYLAAHFLDSSHRVKKWKVQPTTSPTPKKKLTNSKFSSPKG